MTTKIFDETKQKTILFPNGVAKQMNYREVRKQFTRLMHQLMNQSKNKSVYTSVEDDDFMQYLEFELWKAFRDYDPSRKACFSTYLYPKLKKAVRDATFSQYSAKNQAVVVSIDSNPSTLEDTVKEARAIPADVDIEKEYLQSDLFAHLKEELEPIEFDCVIHLVDKKEMSAQNIADKYNMTRQGANKRIRSVKSKLRTILA